MRRSQALRFNKDIRGGVKGIALLSYLQDPVRQEIKGIDTIQFSNNGAGRTWAKVLNNIGYEVDVIDWDNTDFKPKIPYDLIVVHGGRNYQNLLPALKPGGKVVYYSTGSYWRYHNEQETKRFKEFNKRNKITLAQDRYIDDNEEDCNRKADAVISLGNAATVATYADFPSVYGIEGAGYDEKIEITRDYHNTRKHFLFLSGPGNIHKGLDLAIEAFRGLPDAHLHIVGTLNDDFNEFYKKDLYDSANIHTYGYVEQRSPLFYAILRQCSYGVLFSCSEGSPGSVIEMIQQGLVPIVTKETHLDVPPAGIVLPDAKLSTIRKVIFDATFIDPNILAKDTKNMIDYSKSRYSIARFEKELADILRKILKGSK